MMNIRQTWGLIARVAFALLLLPITSVAWGQVDAVSNLDEPSDGSSFAVFAAPSSGS